MNSRIETIEKIREADLNNYRKFTNESEALINQAMDKLQETQMNLNAKILTLQDEKGDLLRGPMSKQELLASVLESYRKGRSDIYQPPIRDMFSHSIHIPLEKSSTKKRVHIVYFFSSFKNPT